MLTTIGAGSSGGQVFDYAGSYTGSKLREKNLALMDDYCSAATESNVVSSPSKYATKTQFKAMVKSSTCRIHWSPSYNMILLKIDGNE
jgi:hypothetical protein